MYLDGTAVYFHIADFSTCQTVPEIKVFALFHLGFFHFTKHLFFFQRIDIEHLLAGQRFITPAIKGEGCRIGIYDICGFRIDQEHNGVVVLKKALVLLFTLPQVFFYLFAACYIKCCKGDTN